MAPMAESLSPRPGTARKRAELWTETFGHTYGERILMLRKNDCFGDFSSTTERNKLHTATVISHGQGGLSDSMPAHILVVPPIVYRRRKALKKHINSMNKLKPKVDVHALRQVSMFKDWNEKHLRLMVMQQSRVRQFPPGQYICREVRFESLDRRCFKLTFSVCLYSKGQLQEHVFMVLSGRVRLIMNIEVKPTKPHSDLDASPNSLDSAFTKREIDVEILGKFGMFGISHQLLRSSKVAGRLQRQQGGADGRRPVPAVPKSPTVRTRMAMYKKNVKIHYNCTAKTVQTTEILMIPKFVFTALVASNDDKVRLVYNWVTWFQRELAFHLAALNFWPYSTTCFPICCNQVRKTFQVLQKQEDDRKHFIEERSEFTQKYPEINVPLSLSIQSSLANAGTPLLLYRFCWEG
jgi:hypothetical protein